MDKDVEKRALVGEVSVKFNLNMPSSWIEALDNLVRRGIYPSRSEAIRLLIYPALSHELKRLDITLSKELSTPKKSGVRKTKKGMK